MKKTWQKRQTFYDFLATTFFHPCLLDRLTKFALKDILCLKTGWSIRKSYEKYFYPEKKTAGYIANKGASIFKLFLKTILAL